MTRYAIGIDVGGTNIKLGLVTRTGKIITRSTLTTQRFHRNKLKLINALVDQVNGLIASNRLKRRAIAGIGIGLPGLVDPKNGIVRFLPNVPGWRNVPLKKIIQKRLHCPVFLENDVNLVTLGEWKFGAGKGCRNLICFTLGTGVGAGLVIDNRFYRGEGYAAGELGHLPLNEKGPKCTCGGWGCFERTVGHRVLQRKAAKIFKRGNIQLPEIYALASRGDRRALRFWEETARHIGNALVGVVNLLNPAMIIVGGGVSNNFRFMDKTINGVIKRRAMKVQSKMVKAVRAKLGDDAGIIGALVLVKEATGERF